MFTAKDIHVAPVSAKVGRAAVLKWHYSGKYNNNTQLWLGAFLNGVLVGVMGFGCSMDKHKIQGLVAGTGWNDFLELNRMAFSDAAPRNSESRALSVAFRIIKKNYPHIAWIVSFADGTQCGDGTIYRASGFVLTGITQNSTIMEAPDGRRFARLVLDQRSYLETRQLAREYGVDLTKASAGTSGSSLFKKAGFKMLPGFMLRYIKFLHPDAQKRLTVPILPFSAIAEAGARMYKGKRIE